MTDPTAPTALPDRKAVRDTFEMLLGKAAPVADGERVVGHADAPHVTTAEIIDDHGTVAAVITADLPLAVYAGAALALTPPGGAEDMVADKDVPDSVHEAFAEVLNVLSAVFNTPGAPHVRLGRVWFGPQEVPVGVAEIARDPGRRDDLRIEVAGYGPGNLSLILA